MKVSVTERIMFGVFILVFLASCGGGGSSTVRLANGGIGGTGIISLGTITAIGSINVNGVKFDTSNASIVIEGEQRGVGDQAVLNNLDIGNVVRVEGAVSSDGANGTATRVVYIDSVIGPVESTSYIDAKTRVIVVLGQTVIIDDRTVFKHTTLGAISRNNVLEVCGLVDDKGAIRATYVSKIADQFSSGLKAKVMGNIGNLETASRTFEINELTLDYSVVDVTHLPGGAPTDGMFVVVKGTLDAIGGKLRVEKVELQNELGTDQADKVEFEGFVTEFNSVFSFTVGNQAVQTDRSTRFEGGRAEDIASGLKLEIEGRLVRGMLLAEAVLFRQ